MTSKKPRRLIVGDIHGCADELAELLFRFKFMPGHDSLFTVGDVVGKGPKTREALELLRQFGARSVLGNHEHHCLVAAATPAAKRTERQKQYLASLEPDQKKWLDHIAAWPLYVEEPDLIIVHAGLDPAASRLSDMRREITTTIRTWDGEGDLRPLGRARAGGPAPVQGTGHGMRLRPGAYRLVPRGEKIPPCRGAAGVCAHGQGLTRASPRI
jgi:hypothetical protein